MLCTAHSDLSNHYDQHHGINLCTCPDELLGQPPAKPAPSAITCTSVQGLNSSRTKHKRRPAKTKARSRAKKFSRETLHSDMATTTLNTAVSWPIKTEASFVHSWPVGAASDLENSPVIKTQTSMLHENQSPTKLCNSACERDPLLDVNGEVSQREEQQGGDFDNSTLDKTGESVLDFYFRLHTEEFKGKTLWYDRNYFCCVHCAYKTRTKMAMKKHMQYKHQELLMSKQPPDKVSVEGFATDRVYLMSEYEAKSSFTTKKRKRNIEKQDMLGVFPCASCGKIFHRLRYLRKHMDIHRAEKNHKCELCNKMFKSGAYLRVHQRVHEQKQYKCNQCEFSSHINVAIHAHRQIHNKGSVLCEICGKAYTDRSTLNKHKRVHDLGRPYACNYPGCTWRFKTEMMCKAHIRAHTVQGKFKCCHCGYVFRHKHHLQRHESNKHGIKHEKTRPYGQRFSAIVAAKQFCRNNNNNNNTETQPSLMLDEEAVGVVVDTTDIGAIETYHLVHNPLQNGQFILSTDAAEPSVTYNDATNISALGSLVEAHEILDSSVTVQNETLVVTSNEEIMFQQE